MYVGLITPAPPRSRKGNRVTAMRWARLLRELGHRVHVEQTYANRRYDILVALHARHSHPSIARFAQERPGSPIIVALTGTDLYGDIHTSRSAQESLELADRLILLQSSGINQLPVRFQRKARVVYQSVRPPPQPPPPRRDVFQVCVLGHLRAVKDPFRTAIAARALPPSSRVRIVHAGEAFSDTMSDRAKREETVNLRYRWLGDLPHSRAMRTLARSRLLTITSKLEGGANVLSEAIALSVPVISSRIDGSIGMLGDDYPGFFPVGDTQALTRLLFRAETDKRFYHSLRHWCKRLASIVDPARERRSLARLLKEVAV